MLCCGSIGDDGTSHHTIASIMREHDTGARGVGGVEVGKLSGEFLEERMGIRSVTGD